MSGHCRSSSGVEQLTRNEQVRGSNPLSGSNMNRNEDVDAWFAASEHPQLALMREIRDVFLSDERITETIKWKTPTFMYKGNLASINPQAKQFVSLLFHTGARIPGHHPRLSGGGETARYMQIEDSADLVTARPALLAIINAWCDLKDA